MHMVKWQISAKYGRKFNPRMKMKASDGMLFFGRQPLAIFMIRSSISVTSEIKNIITILQLSYLKTRLRFKVAVLYDDPLV